MFIELVNQVSAANVSLKTQNYSARSETANSFTGTGSTRGRAGQNLKAKKQKKKSSPE